MRSLFMLLFCDLHSRHKHDFIFLLLRLLWLWKLTPSSQIKVRAPSHTRGCCMGISLSPVHKHGDFCSSQKRKTKQKVARRVRYSLFLKCILCMCYGNACAGKGLNFQHAAPVRATPASFCAKEICNTTTHAIRSRRKKM